MEQFRVQELLIREWMEVEVDFIQELVVEVEVVHLQQEQMVVMHQMVQEEMVVQV
jgi:hypothetical protein